ncbi:MAG: UDP-glucose/GDP-mannose dehydrogenase [Fluviicola sp.]|jgi:nucleoside-diphosphate-sugar epimerase|uniref:NAD(P)-binding domain-containing protein n=1 Tax=Fluviicola sp. TaxID=1917219 RepID=UPI00261B4870|nr:NAD(P)-binding domain-containing protein [Fluviicola sp.]MDF3025717.1 UDP-glucose/GDP-mannose dehydrogenase [Fluviicola sp.]
MKVGIIGLGWLGLPLAKSLLNKGFQVIGTTRSRSVDLSHERFSHVLLDPLQKKQAVSAYLNDVDVLILAFTPSKTDEKTYAKDCVRMLDLASPSCKVIQLSSTSIYPERNATFTESDYPAGSVKTNSVGYAELAISSMLRDRLTVIRLSGLVGPSRYPVTAMSKSGKTYQAFERVNLIHREDAIGLIEHVILNKIWNKTINGCATEHPLKGQFYTEMASKLGIQPPLFEDKTRSERIISNAYSLELGYKYIYPDPKSFPIA